MKLRNAYRGSIFSFKETATLKNLPVKKSDSNDQYIYIEDGLLVVEDGKISQVGSYAELHDKINKTSIEIIMNVGKTHKEV